MWMWILICLGLGSLTILAFVVAHHVRIKVSSWLKRKLDLPWLPPGCG